MPPPPSPARPLPPRSAPRPESSRPRRPPLRVLEPHRRRKQATRSVRRSTIWVSGALVVGSLFAVVAGDALVSEGQVRLATIQGQLAPAATAQKAYQVDVAQKTAPAVLVARAESQGMVANPHLVDLPYVPLDVPLPVPQTAAIPGRAPAAPPAASTAPSGTAPTAGQ